MSRFLCTLFWHVRKITPCAIGFDVRAWEDWAVDTNCGVRKVRGLPRTVVETRYTDAIPYLFLVAALYLILALKVRPPPFV